MPHILRLSPGQRRGSVTTRGPLLHDVPSLLLRLPCLYLTVLSNKGKEPKNVIFKKRNQGLEMQKMKQGKSPGEDIKVKRILVYAISFI